MENYKEEPSKVRGFSLNRFNKILAKDKPGSSDS